MKRRGDKKNPSQRIRRSDLSRNPHVLLLDVFDVSRCRLHGHCKAQEGQPFPNSIIDSWRAFDGGAQKNRLDYFHFSV